MPRLRQVVLFVLYFEAVPFCPIVQARPRSPQVQDLPGVTARLTPLNLAPACLAFRS